MVIAKNYARIHWQNLANFGILALEFVEDSDYDDLEQGDMLELTGLRAALEGSSPQIEVTNTTKGTTTTLRHRLSPRQVEMVLEGGLIPVFRAELTRDGA